MDFLLAYRDPLFGLLVFFGLIFIISFFSYSWSLVKFRRQKDSVEEFFKRFEYSDAFGKLPKTLEARDILKQLAQSFAKEGKYEEAITIYQQLKDQSDIQERLEILEILGDIYKKGGFLQRSKEIYEEILRYKPRSPEILEKLMVVDEKMGLMDEAMEVASILEELGSTTPKTLHLRAQHYIATGQTELLIDIYKKNSDFVRIVFEYLFHIDPDRAWRELNPKDYEAIIDILWQLPKEAAKFDHPFLRELYSAKGYIQKATTSAIFELDILLHYPKATLDFEYLCKKCKNIFPFPFTMCPQCGCVRSPQVELVLAKKGDYETGDSFQ